MKEPVMTTLQHSKRIHPLVAVAAAAVTLFSLVGIAAITGLLPDSHGTVQPTNVQATSEQASAQTAPAETKTESAALTTAKPAAKTLLPKPASRNNTSTSTVQTGAEDTAPRGQVATAPAPVVAPAPAPVAQKQEPKNSPVGIGVGAVIGGVIGNQVGSGDGKTLATILGAVGGGYIGNEVAKQNQK